MAKKKKKEQSVEIRIAIDGLDVTAAPNKHSADFDHLLEQRGAQSFVFIPLAKLDKRRRRKFSKLATMARRKAKLPEGDWYDGELRSNDDGSAVPGVLAFDIRRRNAREIAETVGVKQFLWGTSGAPVEQHAVQVFEDDCANDWKSVRGRALGGLSDMVVSARNIAALPTAVQESQTTMRKFWQLVAVVLGIAIASGALQSLATALLSSEGSTSWLTSIMKILFYPFVVPAVFVGIYLRVLLRRGEEHARDFTAAEAADNWHKVAPHLLALWLLCWIAVLLLTWVQSVPEIDINVDFLGRTSGVTTSFIICVWMLLPIAHSHNVETLFGSAFGAGIAAVISIFTIKLSLYLANLLTDVMWDVVVGLVPFEIPERLQQFINSIINVGAEVFFVAVLLGYAWSRTRQQFMRL